MSLIPVSPIVIQEAIQTHYCSSNTFQTIRKRHLQKNLTLQQNVEGTLKIPLIIDKDNNKGLSRTLCCNKMTSATTSAETTTTTAIGDPTIITKR